MVALYLLAGCSSGNSSATPATTTPPPTTVAATAAPSTTAEATVPTMSELRRNERINSFVDAVKQDRECTAIECLFSDNLYRRWGSIVSKANMVPGDDVKPYSKRLANAWSSWTGCLQQAATMDECGTKQSEVEAAFLSMYDALR